MLKNRQHNDVQSPNYEDGTDSVSEVVNSNSNTAAGVSHSAFSSSESTMSNGIVQPINLNGFNNNHEEHVDDDGQELSSSVVIEVTENSLDDELVALQHAVDMSTDDIETTLEDGAGSSSQDDGMISSAATSTSGSVISVGLDQPAPVVQQPAAPADQPEVTDFLDMDFDVEPTSTDEDEEGDRATGARKEKLFKKDHDFSSANGCRHRRDDFLNVASARNPEGRGCMDDIDYEDDDYYDGPSTSSGEPSTAPKTVYREPLVVSETAECVHGCEACNTADTSRRDRRPRPTTAAGAKVPILGNLSASTGSHASSASSSLPIRTATSDRGFQRHRFYQYSRLTQHPLSNVARFRQHASVNVGGPDGLRLARSAYVGFPAGSRAAGGGFTSRRPGRESGETFRIWSIDEAETIQATQIGPSACGATALINVLKGLGVVDSIATPLMREVEKEVPTRLRANDAPVAEYLLSRSVAGTDAEDLIDAMATMTDSAVRGRFFAMTERTIVTEWQEEQFGRWLLDWLKRGAVPVLTLNMQRGLLPVEPMPDAWHHQMVFGICTRTGGVYLTNPLECVPLWFLKHALCSPSVLLVKAEDVRERWNGRAADLSQLLATSRPEQSTESRPVETISWTEMNVIGQIARTLRQTGQPHNTNSSEPILTHIAIPARYRSGVTLFAPASSDVWTAISNALEMDAALTLPPSRLPVNAFSVEGYGMEEETEPSSVVITVGDEAASGPAEAGPSASDDGEFSDLDEASDRDHTENSQSCMMM